MTSARRRLRRALRAIDGIHRRDPRRLVWQGRARPFELVYAWRMSRWRRILAPDAGELLRIAVRAQHLERWSLPRAAYPAGRRGYLAWRTEQARRHAALLDQMLEPLGYGGEERSRLAALVRKRGLGRDREVQVLEDCAALTFAELEAASFAVRTDPAKLASILERTRRKVSDAARPLLDDLISRP